MTGDIIFLVILGIASIFVALICLYARSLSSTSSRNRLNDTSVTAEENDEVYTFDAKEKRPNGGQNQQIEMKTRKPQAYYEMPETTNVQSEINVEVKDYGFENEQEKEESLEDEEEEEEEEE